MKVDRALIINEALELLNEVGIDALSTRALAERLNVRQPALYWHFKNKRALLDAMNEEILARGHAVRVPVGNENWRSFATENARSFRRALLAYRDGARVHAGTEAGPGDLAPIESQLKLLTGAGIDIALAIELLVAVSRYTVGCVLEEQADDPQEPGRGTALDAAARSYPLTAQALAHYRRSGHAAQFEAGLAMLIDGLASRLNGRAG